MVNHKVFVTVSVFSVLNFTDLVNWPKRTFVAQTKMKRLFDKSARATSFKTGDKVFVLLPVLVQLYRPVTAVLMSLKRR